MRWTETGSRYSACRRKRPQGGGRDWHLVDGGECLLAAPVLGGPLRQPSEDGVHQKGQAGDALHGQQQERRHAEPLAAGCPLQPLQGLHPLRTCVPVVGCGVVRRGYTTGRSWVTSHRLTKWWSRSVSSFSFRHLFLVGKRGVVRAILDMALAGKQLCGAPSLGWDIVFVLRSRNVDLTLKSDEQEAFRTSSTTRVIALVL